MSESKRVDVLFMQSQDYFGSDSMIHSLIMNNLDRARFRVHVACNRGRGGKESASLTALKAIPDLQVFPMDFGPSVNSRTPAEAVVEGLAKGVPGLAGLGRLVRYARRNRIRLVHGTEKPRDAFYGLLVARLVGAKAVTHLHVKVEDWISPLTRWAMAHDDGLIGVSEFVARSAVSAGYPEDRTWWAVNAIEASKWRPHTDGSVIRREFEVKPETPIISIMSRVFPWKGHELLLEALAKVKANGGSFKLLVVGEDDPRATPGHGSHLERLGEVTRRLALEQDVVFTGFRRDTEAVLAATDIYAMPSFEEPCAVAFLEAMAMAKPVIALDSGGTGQLVEHGRSGLLSGPDDADALAANLSLLLGDAELRRRMGEHGRTLVQEYFTPRRLAADVEEIYGRILASIPPTSARLR